jgi:hypothetical protein
VKNFTEGGEKKMTVAQALKRFVIQDETKEEAWSSEKVGEVLEKLKIGDYEIDYEAKAVILKSPDDIYKVMLYTGKKELSDRCRLTVAKFKKKVCLEVGTWQFETKAV